MLKYLNSMLATLLVVLSLSVTSYAQQPKVLWTGSWDVNFFTPQTVSFSTDSKYFVLGYEKGNVIVYEAGTGTIFRNYHLHHGYVFSTVFQPGGTIIASGDKDGFLVLYDYMAEKEIKTINAHDKAITAIAFSRDGKLLLTGSRDNSIKLWDPATGKLLNTIEDVKGNIKALRLTLDNKTIIAGTTALSKGLRLFDARNGVEIKTFDSPNLESLDLSPDGTYVATANLEKFVMLFDIKQYRLVHKLHGHDKNLTDVAWGPTGKVLYSSSNDKTVIAWDVVNTKPFSTIFESQKKISSIACSPDGKYLAVMDENHVFSILDISKIDSH